MEYTEIALLLVEQARRIGAGTPPDTMSVGNVRLITALDGLEVQLGAHAAELGRGSIPLAVNQAKTALAGAIGLYWLGGPGWADMPSQLRLAAAHLQRAARGGAVPGSP